MVACDLALYNLKAIYNQGAWAFEHLLPVLLGGTIHNKNSQYFSTAILSV